MGTACSVCRREGSDLVGECLRLSPQPVAFVALHHLSKKCSKAKHNHILHILVTKKTDAHNLICRCYPMFLSPQEMPTTWSWGSFPQPTNFFQNTTQQRLDFLAQVGSCKTGSVWGRCCHMGLRYVHANGLAINMYCGKSNFINHPQVITIFMGAMFTYVYHPYW